MTDGEIVIYGVIAFLILTGCFFIRLKKYSYSGESRGKDEAG